MLGRDFSAGDDKFGVDRTALVSHAFWQRELGGSKDAIGERLTMVLLMGFAALALLMAAIGVFGVTSYSVSQRTHELGIRMALGANRGSVLALVLRQEMGACLIGIVAGVIGALLMASLLESLLFGVTPRDTATLSIAALVLLAVTMIACVIPAQRATRVDPVTALRLE